MVYNVSGVMNSTNPLEYLQEANNLTQGVAGHGLLIVLFAFVLMMALAYTNHFAKSLLASGLASAFISLILVFAGLCSWYLPVFFAVAVIVGVVMLQDKDYG